MGLIFFYLSIALGISFMCSILEAVLLSTSVSYINMQEQKGLRSSKLLKELKTNIDKPISAILSLNTIAHTIGAAGVGSQAVKVFGEAYFGIISALLTILILVISEIIPKTIGASYWRALALPSAKIIRALIYICYPLVWLSELITKIIAPKTSEATVCREEVSAMIDAGFKEGVFENDESRIMQNLIKLKGLSVREIMTPHIVTQVADSSSTLGEFYKNPEFKPYSRIPVFENQREYISGYVILKDVLEQLADDNFETLLSEIKRPIIAITDTESVSSAWEKMLENKEHIALVVDEYGSFEGIVTLEDIVETILGLEIMDERDTVVDMQQLAREKWQLRMSKYKQLYE